MTDWNPQDAMGMFRYIRFKMGHWTRISHPPDWVESATREYYYNYQDKYGQRPYDVEKVFVGDSLKYKVIYETVAQGEVSPKHYTKIK